MPKDIDSEVDQTLTYDGQQEFRGQVSYVKGSLLQPDQVAMVLNGLLSTKGTVVSRPGRVEIGAEARAPDGSARIRGLGYFDKQGDERLWRVRGGVVQFTSAVDVNSHLLHPWTDTDLTLTASAEAVFAQLSDVPYVADGSALYRFASESWSAVADAPPSPQLLCRMKGKLFAAGNPAAPDALYESDVLDGEVWNPSTRSLRVSDGDSDRIVGLVAWRGSTLVVGKAGSMMTVTIPTGATSMSDYIIDTVPGDYGLAARKTLVPVGNDVWFLSHDGVRSIRRMQAQADNEISLPISEPIRDLMDLVNWEAVETACAMHFRNLYCLAVPIGAATQPNVVLLYNTVTQQWSGAIPGWYPTQWAVSAFGGRKRLVYGDDWGRVHWWRLESAFYGRDISNGTGTKISTSNIASAAVGDLSVKADGNAWALLQNEVSLNVSAYPEPMKLNTQIAEIITGDAAIPLPSDPPAVKDWLPDYDGTDYDVGTKVNAYERVFQLMEREWYFTTIITRAYTFNEPFSEKLGEFIELEFRDSLATAQVYARCDGGDWQSVTDTWDGATAAEARALPQDLPFNLANTGSQRKRWNLLPLGPWRDIQFKIVGLGDRMEVREIFVGAFLEAQEGER